MLQDVEHQILGMLYEGNTHADIAAQICCSKKTIRRKVAEWCSVLA
jgi:DNA-binding NarL/FixJ family response regulator